MGRGGQESWIRCPPLDDHPDKKFELLVARLSEGLDLFSVFCQLAQNPRLLPTAGKISDKKHRLRGSSYGYIDQIWRRIDLCRRRISNALADDGTEDHDVSLVTLETGGCSHEIK